MVQIRNNSVSIGNPRYEIACISHIGLLKDNNEDSVMVDQLININEGQESRYALLAVADGVGGGPVGEVASRVAITHFYNSLMTSLFLDKKIDIDDILDKAFEEANYHIHSLSNDKIKYKGMSTTLTVAFIDKISCYIAHTGDSSCYLIRTIIPTENSKRNQRGQSRKDAKKTIVQRLTPDINSYNNNKKKKYSLPVLGSPLFKSAFKVKIKLKPKDYLMVCSDGLTNLVDDDSILKAFIANNNNDEKRDLKLLCKNLVDTANNAGGTDNISIAVLRLC
jgi:protein phosphatase